MMLGVVLVTMIFVTMIFVIMTRGVELFFL